MDSMISESRDPGAGRAGAGPVGESLSAGVEAPPSLSLSWHAAVTDESALAAAAARGPRSESGPLRLNARYFKLPGSR
jgi:hypothetical protein